MEKIKHTFRPFSPVSEFEFLYLNDQFSFSSKLHSTLKVLVVQVA